MFQMNGEYVIDLLYDELPKGWRFVLKDNCYTGWTEGNDSIRWAIIEPIWEDIDLDIWRVHID